MSAQQNNQKTRQNISPFVAEYRPSVLYLKAIQMSKWHLIENQPRAAKRDLQRPFPTFVQKREIFERRRIRKSKFEGHILPISTNRGLVWPVILPSLYNCLFLRLITNHDNVVLQFTTARIITNYDNRLLQFTIGTLLEFTTTVITIHDRYYNSRQFFFSLSLDNSAMHASLNIYVKNCCEILLNTRTFCYQFSR